MTEFNKYLNVLIYGIGWGRSYFNDVFSLIEDAWSYLAWFLNLLTHPVLKISPEATFTNIPS